jgi:hypothetical protein
MTVCRLLQKTVSITDPSTGEPSAFRIVTAVPSPGPGRDQAVSSESERALHQAIEDAHHIFSQCVENGSITVQAQPAGGNGER